MVRMIAPFGNVGSCATARPGRAAAAPRPNIPRARRRVKRCVRNSDMVALLYLDSASAQSAELSAPATELSGFSIDEFHQASRADSVDLRKDELATLLVAL